MDQRANEPVTLPRADPTTSYWQEPPDEAVADLRTTAELPGSADTVVVGSGITGAAVAWHLLQHQRPGDPGTARVLMLEARQACSGATGRNGGHTKAASYLTFAQHARSVGGRAALQMARLERAGIAQTHGFARARAIDCDLVACDTVDVYYSAAQWAAARAGLAALEAAEAAEAGAAGGGSRRYTLLTAEEVRREHFAHDGVFEGRAERVQGGVRYAAGSLSAYRFGIGVLRACLERGLNLQTGTAVIGLERRGRRGRREGASSGEGEGEVEEEGERNGRSDGGGWRWEVRTTRGTVRARRVVLATNGWTAAIVPRLRGVVVPLRGQVTAQRPGRGLPFGGSLPTTYSFIYEKGFEYMVARPAGSRFAGDVVIGGGLVRGPDEGLLEYGNTDDTTVNEHISEYLREAAARYFGADWGDDDAAGRVRSEWTGIMGFSPDGFPLVGEMPGDDGLWASCSFQGHGMVLCWMCAKALVEMMEGRDGDELREWFPDVFRITEARLAQKFRGHSHTSEVVGEL